MSRILIIIIAVLIAKFSFAGNDLQQPLSIRNPRDFKDIMTSIAERQKASLYKNSTPKTFNLKDQRGSKKIFESLENLKEGGSSDGGGNAIGPIFFDFYENLSAVEITPENLKKIEPAFFQMIDKLNDAAIQMPSNDQSVLLLGDWVLREFAKKIWILDMKPLQSKKCINESMVGTPEKQLIIGCQDNVEVRFYLPWLANSNVSDEYRLGLWTHEALLAWARSLKSPISKEELEKKVRIINRDLFLPDLNLQRVNDLFDLKLINRAELERSLKEQKIQKTAGSQLDQQLFPELIAFCENPSPALITKMEALLASSPSQEAVLEQSIVFKTIHFFFEKSLFGDRRRFEFETQSKGARGPGCPKISGPNIEDSSDLKDKLVKKQVTSGQIEALQYLCYSQLQDLFSELGSPRQYRSKMVSIRYDLWKCRYEKTDQ